MPLNPHSVRPATREEWDLLWRNCDFATYFHSREWAELWSIYSQGAIQPAPEMLVFSDGRQALLPISRGRTLKGLSQVHLLSPGGTYGGYLSDHSCGPSHLEAIKAYLLSKGNLTWRWNPYEPPASPPGRKDVTHALGLSDGFDSLFKQWTKGHKSAAKKAQREGVHVAIAHSQEDWQAYYAIYQDTLRRWGSKASTSYSWDFFNELYAMKSANVRLWLAYYGNEVIAGALLFYAKRHAVYWHGAALEAYFHLRPVHLLMFETIQHACNAGYQWFDFNPSGGNDGVVSFKKGFAAQELPCPIIHTETTFARAAHKLAHLIKGGAR